MKKLPDGWKFVKLSDIANISAGGTPRRNVQEYWNDGVIPWLKISDLKKTYINYAEEKITQKGLDDSSAKIFPKGTIVYSIFATLGAVGILEISAATNQAIAGIIPNNSLIETKYLYHCLQSEKNNILVKKSHATQDNINLTILRNHEIPLPPLPAQKKIAAVLEKAEKLREWRKEADGLIDRFLESTFLELFGDIEKNEKGWGTNAIKEVVLKNEKVNPGKDFPTLQFIYVDISSVNSIKGKIISSSEILGANAPSRAQQKIKTGDLLVSTVRPNLNAVALVPETLDGQICSTGFCILRADRTKILPEYLFIISRSGYFIDSLVKVAKGASYPAVSNKDITSLKIQVPPIELQNKFANIYKQIEQIREYQNQSKQKIDNFFNVLMQKAFNGGVN
ncbi:MAG: restriction endonuclease subunit S [Candidatus Methanoperedens sp.]